MCDSDGAGIVTMVSGVEAGAVGTDDIATAVAASPFGIATVAGAAGAAGAAFAAAVGPAAADVADVGDVMLHITMDMMLWLRLTWDVLATVD